MSLAPRAFIIGHPVGHSRSPLIHGHWLRESGLDGSYEKFAVAPAGLTAFVQGMRDAGFAGGNATVPHKAGVLALADHADAAARIVGAANTLWFEGDRLMASNTDVPGFLQSLDQEAPGWDRSPGMALVIGAGGAARAIVYGLKSRGFAVEIVNRSNEAAEELVRDLGPGIAVIGFADLPARMKEATLLVNTTSLGMEGQPPLDLDLATLHPDALVADIVYVPLLTPLLRSAAARGNRTVGGLGMLLHQAIPGFERWFGVRPRVTPALRALVEADVRGGPSAA